MSSDAIGLPILFNGASDSIYDPLTPLPRLVPKVHGSRNLVERQVAAFIRSDHPYFIEFMEAYYEWMENHGNAFFAIDRMDDHVDIDRTITAFMEAFERKYIEGFPVELAFNDDGKPLDKRKLIKNVINFYSAKGSERSFRLLFRILMNIDVEVYYPKDDILRGSDGKWIQEKSLRCTSRNGTANFGMLEREIRQYDRASKELTAYATVERVSQYSIEQYDVTELFLREITGEFNVSSDVECTLSDGTVIYETLHSVLTGFEVVSGGEGYRLGDAVVFQRNTAGYGGSGEISSVSPKGKVRSVRINEFGINYVSEESVTLASKSGSGTAVVVAKPGVLCNYKGYYSNNDGKLSSNKRLYDGDFYQNFSYALKSEANFERYRDAVKKLVHPAGFKMFGLISFLRNMGNTLQHHSEEQNYEMAIIGHYMPYGLGTTVDLYHYYPNGYNNLSGATLHNTVTLKIYTVGEMTAGSLPYLSGVTYHHGPTQTIFGQVQRFDLYPNGPTGSTQGIVFLMNVVTAGYTGGYTAGGTFAAYGGITGRIYQVFLGDGTVPEIDGYTHDPQGAPLGTSGTEGYTAAQEFGYDHWQIYHHPNLRGIVGYDGSTGSTGSGMSLGPMELRKWAFMPLGYHFHSNPGTGPYLGTTGPNNEYSAVYGGITNINGI